jgi:hypothetical protein
MAEVVEQKQTALMMGSKLLAEIGYLVKAQLRLIDFAFR